MGHIARAFAAPAKALSGRHQPADEARRHANLESQANGALVRVSPLGILVAGAEREAAIQMGEGRCCFDSSESGMRRRERRVRSLGWLHRFTHSPSYWRRIGVPVLERTKPGQ